MIRQHSPSRALRRMTRSRRTFAARGHQRCRTGGWAGRALPVLGDERMRDRALHCRKGAEAQTPRTAVRANVARGSHRARGGVAARRCHAQCEAAEVLTTVCVRSAPTIERPRRLRAGEGPPVRAPPAGGAQWSGAAEVEAVSGSNVRRFKLPSVNHAPICSRCWGRCAGTRSHVPSGRAPREVMDHKEASASEGPRSSIRRRARAGAARTVRWRRPRPARRARRTRGARRTRRRRRRSGKASAR